MNKTMREKGKERIRQVSNGKVVGTAEKRERRFCMVETEYLADV